jgi:starch phosphorylase
VLVEGREVRIRAWRYPIRGVTGHLVPLLFIDADLEENDPRDRAITDHLYGGDELYRLCQETILGLGGVAMLRALGYSNLRVYHMNEGHSALVTLALLEQAAEGQTSHRFDEKQLETVRRQCVFTTHTPVPAGHDCFSSELVERVLGPERAEKLSQLRVMNGALNMNPVSSMACRCVTGRFRAVCSQATA